MVFFHNQILFTIECNSAIIVPDTKRGSKYETEKYCNNCPC